MTIVVKNVVEKDSLKKEFVKKQEKNAQPVETNGRIFGVKDLVKRVKIK